MRRPGTIEALTRLGRRKRVEVRAGRSCCWLARRFRRFGGFLLRRRQWVEVSRRTEGC